MAEHRTLENNRYNFIVCARRGQDGAHDCTEIAKSAGADRADS